MFSAFIEIAKALVAEIKVFKIFLVSAFCCLSVIIFFPLFVSFVFFLAGSTFFVR